jgi:hypothetical protein
MKWLHTCIILTFLQIAFSQSKKEQIAILQTRVDSLNSILLQERNSSNQRIQGLNTKISSLESKITTLNTNLTDLKKEAAECKTDTQRQQLKMADLLRQIESKTDSLEKLRMEIDNQMLAKWLTRNLNLNIPNLSKKLRISRDLTEEIKLMLQDDYWLGLKPVKKVQDNDFYISVDLSDEEYRKTLLLSEDYLIVSYHLTFGSDGNSFIVNLKTLAFYTLDGIYVNSIESKNTLKVELDYYDNEGHVWEYGKYYITEEKYEFISKEH